MGWLSIDKNESLAFVKGWFKISFICFGLNAVLWHRCIAIFGLSLVRDYIKYVYHQAISQTTKCLID